MKKLAAVTAETTRVKPKEIDSFALFRSAKRQYLPAKNVVPCGNRGDTVIQLHRLCARATDGVDNFSGKRIKKKIFSRPRWSDCRGTVGATRPADRGASRGWFSLADGVFGGAGGGFRSWINFFKSNSVPESVNYTFP